MTEYTEHEEEHFRIDALPPELRGWAGAAHMRDTHGVIVPADEAEIEHFILSCNEMTTTIIAKQRATLLLFNIG